MDTNAERRMALDDMAKMFVDDVVEVLVVMIGKLLYRLRSRRLSLPDLHSYSLSPKSHIAAATISHKA